MSDTLVSQIEKRGGKTREKESELGGKEKKTSDIGGKQVTTFKE